MEEKLNACFKKLRVRFSVTDKYFRFALKRCCELGKRPDDLYDQAGAEFNKIPETVSRGIARVGRRVWDQDNGVRVRQVLNNEDFDYIGPEDLIDHLLDELLKG